MRHKLKGRKLGRTTAHRQAMERNIVTSLFVYGRIITTVDRAKEFRRTAEKLITLGKKSNQDKKAGLKNFRRILSVVQDRGVAHKVVEELAVRFKDRPGGYTRVVRLGGCRWDGDGHGLYAANRLGDDGKKAIWELVDRREQDEEVRMAGRGRAAKKDREEKKAERKSKAKAKSGASKKK